MVVALCRSMYCSNSSLLEQVRDRLLNSTLPCRPLRAGCHNRSHLNLSGNRSPLSELGGLPHDPGLGGLRPGHWRSQPRRSGAAIRGRGLPPPVIDLSAILPATRAILHKALVGSAQVPHERMSRSCLHREVSLEPCHLMINHELSRRTITQRRHYPALNPTNTV